MRGGPVLDMMDFAPIAAHVATGARAAAVLGTNAATLRGLGLSPAERGRGPFRRRALSN
jgi:hypothetical protein